MLFYSICIQRFIKKWTRPGASTDFPEILYFKDIGPRSLWHCQISLWQGELLLALVTITLIMFSNSYLNVGWYYQHYYAPACQGGLYVTINFNIVDTSYYYRRNALSMQWKLLRRAGLPMGKPITWMILKKLWMKSL